MPIYSCLKPCYPLKVPNAQKIQFKKLSLKYKSIELSILIFDAPQMSYMPFMHKNYRTCKAKNKLQVDFSHKLSKNEFFKLRNRHIIPIYMVYLKIILPNLIYINRVMFEYYNTFFLKTLFPLKAPN